MPRSKKDVMKEMQEKATPENILESYYSQCHCWGDQYGGWGPCDICRGQRIALRQLEEMREQLEQYDEINPFKITKKFKEELANRKEEFKPIRGRSIDDATPEEWDEASKKVREMTEQRGGSVRCMECGGDGISEHPHSKSRDECYVCDGTGMSSYGRTETRKLCQSLAKLAASKAAPAKCHHCDGAGHTYYDDGHHGHYGGTIDCSFCEGTGKIHPTPAK